MLDAFIKILTISVWPAVVLWLAWYLRDEIKRVAGRTVKAGLSGVEFAPPPPEQVASSPSDRVLATVAASQTSQVGTLQAFVARIRGFLSDEQVEGAAQKVRADLGALGPNPTDQVEGLVYLVASLHIQLLHEKNYNSIYGSQLRLMEQMIGAVLRSSWHKKYTTRQNQHFLKSIATSRSSSGSRSW